MPCTCDGYPEPKPDQHNGPLAEALCDVLRMHEERGEMSCFSKATLKWWKEHKARDKARIEQDLARIRAAEDKEKALKKLTAYERKLLGL